MSQPGTRITNGQRAAVAGLIIAGIGFRKACGIVDAPTARMHALLPARFCVAPVPKRGGGPFFRSLTEAGRRELRELWLGGCSVSEIARRYGVHIDVIKHAVVRLGLPGRPKWCGRPPSPRGIRQMSPAQRTIYKKFRGAYGREAALKAVFG